MKTYDIDLCLPPRRRWQHVDPLPVRELVSRARKEANYGQLLAVAGWALGPTMRYWLPESCKEYFEEIEGLAAVTGIPYAELLGLNLVYDYTACTAASPVLGCTAMMRPNPKTGKHEIFRAMDWAFPSNVGEFTEIHVFRAGKRNTVSIGLPGFVGVITGYGVESRTFGAINQANVSQFPLRGIPAPWLLRRALCRSLSAESAASVITASTAASSAFYLLLDPLHGIRVESQGNLDWVYSMEEWGPLAHANHFTDAHPAGPVEEGDTFHRLEAANKAARSRTPQGALRGFGRYPLYNADTAYTVHCTPATGSLKISRDADPYVEVVGAS